MNYTKVLICYALLTYVFRPTLWGQHTTDQLLLDRLPLVFEPNRGQAPANVVFLARGTYSIFLQPDRAVLVLPSVENSTTTRQDHQSQSSVVTLQLLHSNQEARAQSLDLLPGKSNYFIGRQSANWKTGIPQYGTVAFKSIYPGTDLVYYGANGQLECDFVLSPGADPHSLSFRLTGAEDIELNASGNLLLHVPHGIIELRKPTIYQKDVDGTRHEIAGNFALHGDEVNLSIGDYDTRKQLIIDPVLSYSTLIGANNGTQVQGVGADPQGDVYIVGTTRATNYPTVAAFQPVNKGSSNVFITKLSSAGNVILYSTYLGGSLFDNAAAIAVDSNGSAYVTGTAGSSDFPTTPGAFMTSCPAICNTPFVAKFLTDGNLAFSTYIGGSNSPAHAIAVNSAGEAYIAGDTASNDLPTTPGSFEPTYPGLVCSSCYNGYVEKLNASGTALIYSTYFGLAGFGGVPSTVGSGIAVDSAGSAYLVGSSSAIPVQNPIQASLVGGPNAFIAKFSPDGSSLVYSTYIGGSSPFFFGSAGDFATGVAVDPFGNAHVTGTSSSCEFPLTLSAFSTDCVTTSNDQKVFVLTLNPTGGGILFSTFLRSGAMPQIAVDQNGNSYVAGVTGANDFPVIQPIESTSQRSIPTSFITELDLSGRLLFSTYLGAKSGGSQVAGIAVDSKGGIYVAGAGQADFPLVHPIPSQVLQSTSYTVFVAKVSPNNTPQVSLSPRVSPLLTLRNVSSVPLAISSIVPSTNFIMGGDCASSLAPGGGCNLILEGAADNKTSGTVTITSNAYKKPQQFTIFKSPTGDTVGPIVSIFPLYVQFASQLIGTSGAAEQVVIENVGLQPAAINSITITQPSAFNQINDCPALLNPAASCTISITYSATTVQDSAQLAIVHDPYQTQDTVFLSGLGSGSAIAFSTNSVEFGNQSVGVAPLGRIVNLINTTPYPNSAPTISTSTGFAQSNTCTTTLAPQASCRVSVTFVPTGNQDSTGTLTASSFGPGRSQTVNLHATGIAPGDLSVSPVALSFFGYVGNETGPETVTVTNNSPKTISITKIEVGAPFVQTNTCPTSLAPAATCQVSVFYRPKQAGSARGTLQVTFTGTGSPQSIGLTGTAQTIVQFYPTSVQFGQQPVNVSTPQTTVFVENNGAKPVILGTVTLQGGDFSIVYNGCGTRLDRNTGCILEVLFTPAATGLRTGTLSVVASDIDTPHTAILQGIGISSGNGTLSPSSLDFGTQAVGTYSQPENVTLTNSGTGALALNGISVSPNFFTQTNTCPSSLVAGASCTISINFSPTLQGMLVGALSVQDDGAGSPHTVTLSGIGVVGNR